VVSWFHSLFSNSNVYQTRLVSLRIGYGVVAPATTGGRVFTLFYAIVGVGLLGYNLAVISGGGH
jgi:hypothetical protein